MNCFITKIDERTKKDLNPLFLLEQFKGGYFRNRTLNSTPNETKKRSNSSIRNNISLIGPSIRKKGF
jgi:hypothetical protein